MTAQPDRPNVLIVQWDEMRADTTGYMHHPVVQTPNLDRLAAISYNFTDHHSVSPVCAPARHAFFTGKYPHVVGTPGGNMPLRPGVRFWPEIMNDHGYLSAVCGKLHHTPTNDPHGFSIAQITDSRNRSNAWIKWLEEQGLNYHADKRMIANDSEPARERLAAGKPVSWGRSSIPEEYTETAFVANETVSFLANVKQEPFMFHASFKRPHDPHLPPAPWDRMYSWQQVTPPAIPECDIRDKPRFFQHCRKRWKNKELRPKDWADMAANYFGLISHLDHHLGRILDTLERNGLLDTTLVIFTSDHGTMLGEHGFYGKFFNYEESTHIPLLIHLPGQQTGSVISKTNSNIDVMPTALDYCDIPVPGDLQGRSLRPLIEGTDADWDETFVMSATGIGRDRDGRNPYLNDFKKGLRTERWKVNLVSGLVDGEWATDWELYDRVRDPREVHNLAGDPEYREVFETMRNRLWLEVLKREATYDFTQYGIGVE